MRRPFDNLYKIGSAPILATENGVGVETEDLISSESGRDESGYFHPDFIRTNVRAFRLSYSALTPEEYQYMNRILKSGKILKLTYDPPGGVLEQIDVYAQKSGYGYFSKRLGMYMNCSFDLIEL